jgi:hypothetical protein
VGEEGQGILAGSVGAFRLTVLEHGNARGGVESDKAGISVAELEAHRPVNSRPGVRATRVIEIVVANDANVWQR